MRPSARSLLLGSSAGHEIERKSYTRKKCSATLPWLHVYVCITSAFTNQHFINNPNRTQKLFISVCVGASNIFRPSSHNGIITSAQAFSMHIQHKSTHTYCSIVSSCAHALECDIVLTATKICIHDVHNVQASWMHMHQKPTHTYRSVCDSCDHALECVIV